MFLLHILSCYFQKTKNISTLLATVVFNSSNRINFYLTLINLFNYPLHFSWPKFIINFQTVIFRAITKFKRPLFERSMFIPFKIYIIQNLRGQN
jgi:hypothetical protein